MLPRKPKNPTTLRAASFVAYMMSEMFQKKAEYGLEGVDYTVNAQGVPVLKPEAANSPRAQGAPWTTRDEYWAMVKRQQVMAEMGDALKVLAPAIRNFRDISVAPEAISVTYPTDSEELKIYAQIKEMLGDEITRIVTGPADKVEAGYRALMARADALGIKKLNDYIAKKMAGAADLVKKWWN